MFVDDSADAAPLRMFGMGAKRQRSEQRATGPAGPCACHDCSSGRKGGAAASDR